jgi:hypothetical protein
MTKGCAPASLYRPHDRSGPGSVEEQAARPRKSDLGNQLFNALNGQGMASVHNQTVTRS